ALEPILSVRARERAADILAVLLEHEAHRRRAVRGVDRHRPFAGDGFGRVGVLRSQASRERDRNDDNGQWLRHISPCLAFLRWTLDSGLSPVDSPLSTLDS